MKGVPKAPGAKWKGKKQIGVSAIEKLPEVIKSLIELEAKFNKIAAPPLFEGKSTNSMVIGKVSGGTYETITAGECSIRGVVYFGPNIGSVRQVMGEIRNAISKTSEKDPWFKDPPLP